MCMCIKICCIIDKIVCSSDCKLLMVIALFTYIFTYYLKFGRKIDTPLEFGVN